MTTSAPTVEFRGVSKAFGDRRVLDDVSLSVRPGQSLCILGRSGTGKSVTLKTIVGLITPDAGEVLIDGRDIVGMRSRELAEVGLEREYDKMPSDLSGGMRKRAGLARAMVLGPSILLVDEPSAGLDPVTASDVDTLLVSVREHARTSLVVVTHNIPSARAIRDELIFLHEGRILAQGTADALDRSDVPLIRDFMKSTGAG